MTIESRRRYYTLTPSTYKCDRCSRILGKDAPMDTQEVLHHEATGGYGSIFGDGVKWSITLCQICVKDVLGEWVVKEKTI